MRVRAVLRKYYIGASIGLRQVFSLAEQMVKPPQKDTGAMPRRRRRWSSTIHHLLFDVVTLARLAVTSHAQLAAENVFLRKQLALYQERRLKPKRPDPATRVVLVVLSRECSTKSGVRVATR